MIQPENIGRGWLTAPSRLTAWAVFFIALGVHGGYIADVRLNPGHGYSDYHRAQGSPCFDAAMWHEMGLELSLGWGWHTWTGRRPVYGWFLAVLYALTGVGWSYVAALAANAVFIALAAALFFLALRRLFGDLAAVCVAGSVTFSDQAFLCSSVTLSEGLGLFLLAWHFWLLIVGAQQRRLSLLAGSGALLALSNATRTLTLLATPLYALVLAWLFLNRGATRRQAVWAGALPALTTAAVILAFMAQNYLRVGIFSLSDNTAGDLYAVTAPQYGQWTPEVLERIQREQKIWQTRDLYDYQMRLARENLRAHPGLFLSRVIGHVRGALAHLLTYDGPWLAAFLALGGLGWNGEDARVGWLGRLVIVGLAVVAVSFAPVRGVLLVAGLLWAMFGRPRPEARLLAALFLGTLVAVGLFGSSMQRLFLMFQWTCLGLQLGVLGQLLAWLQGTAYRAWREPRSLPPLACRSHAWTWQLAATPLLLATALVIHRNIWAQLPHIPSAALESGAAELANAALVRAPQLFTATERATLCADAVLPLDVSVSVVPERHGALGALCAIVEPQAYYFTARAPRPMMPDAPFQPRPYERTVLRLAYRNANGPLLPVFVLAPGDLRHLAGRSVCVLGRVHGEGAAPVFLEALACCPWSGNDAHLDVHSLRLFAGDPEHCRVLEQLALPIDADRSGTSTASKN